MNTLTHLTRNREYKTYPLDAPLMDIGEMKKFADACHAIQDWLRIDDERSMLREVTYRDVLAEPLSSPGFFHPYNIGDVNPVTIEDNRLQIRIHSGALFFIGPDTYVTTRSDRALFTSLEEMEKVLFAMVDGRFVDYGRWDALK